jgi:hypothetical protein
MEIDSKILDGRARYAARKIGLKASKTRDGGFQITNPHLDTLLAEDMTAEQVIEYCKRAVDNAPRGS